MLFGLQDEQDGFSLPEMSKNTGKRERPGLGPIRKLSGADGKTSGMCSGTTVNLSEARKAFHAMLLLRPSCQHQAGKHVPPGCLHLFHMEVGMTSERSDSTLLNHVCT